jgi:hypothetical protein
MLGRPHDETSNSSKSVNPDIDWFETTDTTISRIDNVGKLWFQRGTAHEESINIRLGNESGCRGSRGGTTIEDARIGRDFSTGYLTQILSNGLVRILSLFRSGRQTSTNGPNGFVSNDNILPVVLSKNVGIRLDLRKDKVIGSPRLTIGQWFSTASNDFQALV